MSGEMMQVRKGQNAPVLLATEEPVASHRDELQGALSGRSYDQQVQLLAPSSGSGDVVQLGRPAATKSGGKCLGFPDTCHIPAPPPPAGPGGIPTPYPNIGLVDGSMVVAGEDAAKAKAAVGAKETGGLDEAVEAVAKETGDSKGGKDPEAVLARGMQALGSVKLSGTKEKRFGAMSNHNGGSDSNRPRGRQIAPRQSRLTIG